MQIHEGASIARRLIYCGTSYLTNPKILVLGKCRAALVACACGLVLRILVVFVLLAWDLVVALVVV